MTTAAPHANQPAIQTEVARLRGYGYTYAQIARQVGLPNAQRANYAHLLYRRNFLGEEVITGGSSRRSTRVTRQGAWTAEGLSTEGRRFGVEIEVNGLRIMAAYRALTAAGFSVDRPEGENNYTHAVSTSWKIVYDCTVNGCEVVSPPLSGEAGLAEVAEVMRVLRSAGATVDSNTGLHVHHEVADLTGEELARVIEMFAATQGTMNALVARTRRQTTSMIGPLAAHEVAGYAAAFRADGNRQDIRAHGIGGRPGARYRNLNVHSYPTYGTFEFRQHQGSLNGRKAAAWITFGQALIEAAKADTDLALAEGADLLNILLPADQAAYLTNRIAALA